MSTGQTVFVAALFSLLLLLAVAAVILWRWLGLKEREAAAATAEEAPPTATALLLSRLTMPDSALRRIDWATNGLDPEPHTVTLTFAVLLPAYEDVERLSWSALQEHGSTS